MEYVIPFSAGAVHKLYDDITDNHVQITEFQMEFLKVLMVILMTVCFMKSPTTSFLYMIAVIVYWALGNIDNNFWKACTVMPFITSLSTMSEWSFLGVFDVLQRIVFVSIFAISFFVEEKLFPEETSDSKTLFRGVFVAIIPVLIWFTRGLSSGHFVMSFGLFAIGYLVSNLLFQMLVHTVPETEDA